MALSKKNAALLASIVAAMAVEATPYAMLTEAEIAALAKEGLVETNPEIKDGDKIATRATDKGVAVHAELNPPPAGDNGAGAGDNGAGFVAPTAPAATGGFATGTGFVPSPSRGGRGRSLYDFDGLPVGGCIFVPATTEKPTPAKSLASTVSSATKRYADKTPKRKFGVQSVEQGKTYGSYVAPGNGAVIYRSE